MAKNNNAGVVIPLADSSLTVSDPAEDVRGLKVVDRHGDELGDIDDLMLDDRDNRVRFLRVAHGGFLGIGESHFLLPVDAVVRIDDAHVHVDRERSAMGETPGYDPDLAEQPDDYYTGVYSWWGYPPYWTPGYMYPAYPVYPAGARRASDESDRADDVSSR